MYNILKIFNLKYETEGKKWFLLKIFDMNWMWDYFYFIYIFVV